uniref:Uncharacterized protein n=1 Tax=Oryza brachyantha TaxID=4533 RepID=J3LPC0_ORYBR
MHLANQEKGNVDDYNIYAPQCHDASNPSGSSDSVTFDDPCTNHYVSSYLNDPKVQRALHANTTELNYPWMDCRIWIRIFNQVTYICLQFKCNFLPRMITINNLFSFLRDYLCVSYILGIKYNLFIV